MSKPFWRRKRWLFPLVAALALADIYLEVNYPKRIDVSLAHPQLPAGTELRVLHLSDVHNKAFPDGNAAFETMVKSARADFAVITGDLIDHKTPDLQYMRSFIDRLKTLVPTIYYVTGNHEWGNPLRKELLTMVRSQGVHVLNNRREVFTKGPLSLDVVGLDDPYTHHDDLEKAASGLDPKRFALLIAHSPAPARSLAGHPIDLMLAGHTHGGQVRIPIIGAIAAPGEGFFPHFDRGLFPLAENQQLYIDSGLGWSLLPLRMFCRSQFSVLTLTSQ